MLVRFKSEVGGFTMFGDVAVKLLKMSGHSGTVPGAIPADKMADAIERLEHALGEEPPPPGDVDAGAGGEPPVALRQRAFPLLELMRRALDEECAIQWDQP